MGFESGLCANAHGSISTSSGLFSQSLDAKMVKMCWINLPVYLSINRCVYIYRHLTHQAPIYIYVCVCKIIYI